MQLIETLVQLAGETGCSDVAACRVALQEAAREQKPLVSAILDGNWAEERRFLQRLGDWLGVPWWEAAPAEIPENLRARLPVRTALRYQVLPQQTADGTIWMLHSDPFHLTARQVLPQLFGQSFRYAMAPRRIILEGLRQGYGVGAETFEQLLEGREGDTGWLDNQQEVNVLDEEDSEASVVKFVNQILKEALQQRATDIHIEPMEDDMRIRYRIDGVLHEVPVPSRIKVLQASVLSRIKIMAHLDIAERRLPQDGRINLEFEGEAIDVRVATIPSVTGETISLRLLGQQQFSFAMLGLDERSETTVRDLLAMPNGIVLVTGPTGSGKSTSLYTFLSSLNVKERRIVTIEDPVEHKLPGVIQIAVKAEIDLTFARGLRSILRGDPNVIMIGEMRDFETAEIAIRAALTGHLVLSTLHTNDAIGGITRLVDMGVEPFLVSNSVRAFIAQRLVRKLCPHCKTPVEHSLGYLKEIGFPALHAKSVHKAVGCERCRYTGYEGRTAIFEIVTVSPQLQELITQKKPATVLHQVALGEGMQPLRLAGWSKVIAGQTTIEEVIRVTASDLALAEEA